MMSVLKKKVGNAVSQQMRTYQDVDYQAEAFRFV